MQHFVLLGPVPVVGVVDEVAAVLGAGVQPSETVPQSCTRGGLQAGFLDNLVLEAEGRRILVKGRTSKEMVLVEETERAEVYRERLKATVTTINLDDGEITDIAA